MNVMHQDHRPCSGLVRGSSEGLVRIMVLPIARINIPQHQRVPDEPILVRIVQPIGRA